MSILKKDKISSLIIVCLIITIISAVMFSILTIKQYSDYRKDINIVAGSILETIKDKYPNVKEEDILKIYNSVKDNSLSLIHI